MFGGNKRTIQQLAQPEPQEVLDRHSCSATAPTHQTVCLHSSGFLHPNGRSVAGKQLNVQNHLALEHVDAIRGVLFFASPDVVVYRQYLLASGDIWTEALHAGCGYPVGLETLTASLQP